MTYTTQLDTTKLSNGPHTISATACDKAGNCTTASEQVIVNNPVAQPPKNNVAVGAVILIAVIIGLSIYAYNKVTNSKAQ